MIRNVHQREYPVPAERLGWLLDRVAEPDSPLWPVRHWPPVVLDRPLGVGATGGHGPIRYHCTAYEPGRRAEFTFDIPILRGTHTFDVLDTAEAGTAVLRHTLAGRPAGQGHLLWPVVFRWLHDACLEDLLDRAADSLGHPPARRGRWSPYVRLLRRLAPRPRSTAKIT